MVSAAPLVGRLVKGGERVVDVPAKLSAQSRVFDTGRGGKTDAHDAHAIVMVALRDKQLREVVIDEDLEVLRLLVNRRDELAAARTQALNRAHRLFAEVTPGGAPTKIHRPVPDSAGRHPSPRRSRAGAPADAGRGAHRAAPPGRAGR